MKNWRTYTLTAVVVTAAGFAYVNNSRGHMPTDLRDAPLDNEALDSRFAATEKGGVTVPVPKAAPSANDNTAIARKLLRDLHSKTDNNYRYITAGRLRTMAQDNRKDEELQFSIALGLLEELGDTDNISYSLVLVGHMEDIASNSPFAFIKNLAVSGVMRERTKDNIDYSERCISSAVRIAKGASPDTKAMLKKMLFKELQDNDNVHHSRFIQNKIDELSN